MPAAGRINYGKKELVMKDTDYTRPIMFLVNRDGFVQETCYCSACRKTFRIPDYEEIKDSERGRFFKWDSYKSSNAYRDNALSMIPDVCPECGNGSEDIVKLPVKQLPSDMGRDSEHINYSDAYEMPAVPNGRYLFEYRDGDGNVTRVDDNLMMHTAIIFPSGKIFHYDTEYSEATDLVKNQIRVSRTKITGDRRDEQRMIDSLDTFKYPNASESMSAARWNINHVRGVSTGHMGITVYNVLLEELNKPYPAHNVDKYPQMCGMYYKSSGESSYHSTDYHATENVSPDDYGAVREENGTADMGQKMDDRKRDAVLSRFKDKVHPVYTDVLCNGLFLAEHHIGSNAWNTNIDDKLVAKYMTMAVKYPAAFEYACSRADARITDWSYAQQRKTGMDAKEAAENCPDTLRAKIFREETEFVCEQLGAIDDKVLKTIGVAKDVKDMRAKLSFYVFGKDGDGAEVPGQIRLKDGNTMQDPTTATKKLKREFDQNMIGVANTAYTCSKLGIRDVNHVMSVIDIANGSPDIFPKRRKKDGQTMYEKEKPDMFRDAKTIVPVQERSAMRFLKNYSNAHNPTDFIRDVYCKEGWDQTTENIRIYDDILTYADIANTKEQAESVVTDLMKTRVANYLMQKSVRDAYVDFVEVFGDKTKKEVDRYAYMVKCDRKLAQMKADYDSRGLAFLKEKHADMLAAFPPYCDNSDDAAARFAKNPDGYIKGFFDSYEIVGEEKKVVVATRNGKPLFYDRNMGEIHDELVKMHDGIEQENVKIDYDDDELALEGEYDAPDVPGSKWIISLHKDTNEMIRTASELHNCLKSHTKMALKKDETLLFMRNELGEKVACISVKKQYDGSWMCDECQGDHDTAIHERYAPVLRQWAEENHIKDGPKRNLEKMGQRKEDGNLIAFYGAGNADYHQAEIDETIGVQVTVADAKKIAERRREMAVALYGDDGTGNPAVPDEAVFPEYLCM